MHKDYLEGLLTSNNVVANINTNISFKDCYNLLIINNDYFTQLISKYN